MLKYSVCIDAVLARMTPLEALTAVRNCGFENYEFWGWWDRDTDALLAAQKATGLIPVCFCTPMISLVDARQRSRYLDGLRQTLDLCDRFGCRTVITQVGQVLPGVSREVMHASLADGLRACIPLLSERGVTLVAEPLNTRVDHPGYYLDSAREGFELIEEVGSEHVRLLYDLYHQSAMGDLDLNDILSHLPLIRHFHAAGCPGRHEPLVPNSVDYPAVMRMLESAGYEYTVGLEYFPAADAEKGLRQWMRVMS